MKRNVNLFLQDILERISLIENSTKDISKSTFLSNSLVSDATIRRLEIIGEAVKNIPVNFRKKYLNVPWKKVSGLRDIITHGYFGIDLEIVWDIIKFDLPPFKEQIKKIFSDLSK